MHGCGAWLRRMVAVHSGGGNTQVNLVASRIFLENGTLVFLSGTHIFLFFPPVAKETHQEAILHPVGSELQHTQHEIASLPSTGALEFTHTGKLVPRDKFFGNKPK